MTEAISKDQAITAMILWEQFTKRVATRAEFEHFLTTYTESNARYAMVEMAKDADAVFELITPSEQDRLSEDNLFHGIMLDLFDYQSGQIPRLKHSHQEIAAWFVDNFGLTQEQPASTQTKTHP